MSPSAGEGVCSTLGGRGRGGGRQENANWGLQKKLKFSDYYYNYKEYMRVISLTEFKNLF